MYFESVQRQTGQIFDNLDILLEAISADEFGNVKGGFPTWKQFYHCIHSIDKNFIDPANYTEPAFQEKNMDVIYLDTPTTLSKIDIERYYAGVKAKITAYIDALTDEKLIEKVSLNAVEYTRLELILAQLRHVFYHVGYLHCCEKIEKGETPEYVGLYKRIPDR